MNTLRLIASRTTILIVAAFSVACTTAPSIQSGSDAEVSYDGLHKVDNSQADLAWARPDFDISGYDKIMMVGAGITYAQAEDRSRTSISRSSSSGPYFISDEAKTRFEALVSETFADEMSKIENFEIVTEVGPDVLLIWGGLLEVASFVPMDPNRTPGRSSVYLSQVGEATLVLELRDSESGTVLARSVDRRAAETAGGTFMDSNRVTNTAEVRRLVRTWARRLREGLDGFTESSTAQ
jgi:hypothetical protein